MELELGMLGVVGKPMKDVVHLLRKSNFLSPSRYPNKKRLLLGVKEF